MPTRIDQFAWTMLVAKAAAVAVSVNGRPGPDGYPDFDVVREYRPELGRPGRVYVTLVLHNEMSIIFG